MGPDYRLLVRQARKVSQQYFRTYLEPIPTTQLVQRLAAIMQEYTQSGYVFYIFSVSLILYFFPRKCIMEGGTVQSIAPRTILSPSFTMPDSPMTSEYGN